MCIFTFTPQIAVTEAEIEAAIYYGMIPKDLNRDEQIERVRGFKLTSSAVNSTVPADYYEPDLRREALLKGQVK